MRIPETAVLISLFQCTDGPADRGSAQSALPVLESTWRSHLFILWRWGRLGLADWPPQCVRVVVLRTADASFEDLCGAVASAHCLPGGSDCQPAADDHSRSCRRHEDVLANQVLHGTGGFGAVSERDELQLRGGDVLRLAGKPQECSQGKERWSPLLAWRGSARPRSMGREQSQSFTWFYEG